MKNADVRFGLFTLTLFERLLCLHPSHQETLL
ncbi:hypothetical protein FHR70_002247 [Microvirga lupini]|uniref:Uncharacterized protein n=1 Tax=Microvirga lupini TaxID=420324 RepID=A0A7W4YXN0_9HYPH|nr:hypothetical protein [Microvirga lupini]